LKKGRHVFNFMHYFKKLIKYLLYFCLFGLGFGAGYFVKSNNADANSTEKIKIDGDYTQSQNTHVAKPSEVSKGIPSKVLEVLAYVDKNASAMDGYVGGRTFKNLEKLLPKNNESGSKIKYQEWDVNPKQQGRNRGTERLITGDDHSAYFTNDHYNTFKKIR
jgi:ribonuclease T1